MVEIRHIPVLLQETIDGLHIQSGDVIVDGTLGSGGHTIEILKRVLPEGKVLAMDTDEKAIERCRQRMNEETWMKDSIVSERVQFFHNNFSQLGSVLDTLGRETVSGILVDLGFSSDQMDTAERGLSFLREGPLDMRLNQETALTAEHIIHEYSESAIATILREYGEEHFAQSIARALVRERAKQSLKTTVDLAHVVAMAVPKKFHSGKIHPATKTFQALRIAVNDERHHLQLFLSQAVERLAVGARLAVISFHSGEDRIVKQFFRENARGCICPKEFPICQCSGQSKVRIITMRPLVPSDEERERNPRSRSAKLRIAERV